MSLAGRWKLTPSDKSAIKLDTKSSFVFGNSVLYQYLQDPSLEIIFWSRHEDNDQLLIFNVLINDDAVVDTSYSFTSLLHTPIDEESMQITILQNCDVTFRTISIMRIGPLLRQRSCEHFFLDNDGILRFVIMSVDESGELHTIKRSFCRQHLDTDEEFTPFTHYTKTLGWDVLKYWPATVLELCQVKLAKVVRVRFTEPITEEIIWSLDQSVEDIKKTNFTDNGSGAIFRVEFNFQVVLGAQSWTIRRTSASVVCLNELVRIQNDASSETVNNLFRKLPNLTTWKNYVELHRHVLAIDNLFRAYVQNANNLHQNAIDSICAFLEIPCNIDKEQVKLIESTIEMEGIVRSPTASALPRFKSFRMDAAGVLFDDSDTAVEVAAPPQPPAAAVEQEQSKPAVTITTTSAPPTSAEQDDESSSSKLASPSSASAVATRAAVLSGPRGPPILSKRDSFMMPVRSAPVPAITSPVVMEAAEAVQPVPPPTQPQPQQRPATGKEDTVPTPSSSSNPVPTFPMLSVDTSTSPVMTSDGPQLIRSFSNDGGDFNEIYDDGSTPLKYMPVEMVSTPKVKTSIAKSLLFDVLSVGLTIIKHGRQGKPKRKILKCDALVTTLLWFPDRGGGPEDYSEGKGLRISDIIDVRLGTDLDTSNQTTTEIGSPSSKNASPSSKKSSGSGLGFLKLFSSKPNPNEVLYGSAVLRRNCTPDDLAVSLVLVLPDRTFDIQCLNRKDFDFLSINLRELVKPPPAMPSAPSTSIITETSPSQQHNMEKTSSFKTYGDNPLKGNLSMKNKVVTASPGKNTATPKKSVRFVGEVDTNNASMIEGAVSSKSRSMDDMSRSNESLIQVGQDGNLDVLLGNNIRAVASLSADDDPPLQPQSQALTPLTATQPEEEPIDEHAQFVAALKMSSTEALQIGLILSDQERKYGLNMYEALQPSDKPMIDKYVSRGFTTEEAILRLFEKTHVPPHLQHMSPKHMAVEAEMTATSEDITQDEKADETAAVAPNNADTGSSRPKTLAETGRKSSFFPNLFDDNEQLDIVTRIKAKYVVKKDSLPPHEADKTSPTAVVSPTAAGTAENGGVKKFNSPKSFSPKGGILKIRSTDALQTGLQLSQQEEKYGTNMYESLQPGDAAEIKRMIAAGMSTEEAVFDVFKKRFIIQPASQRPLIPPPQPYQPEPNQQMYQQSSPFQQQPQQYSSQQAINAEEPVVTTVAQPMMNNNRMPIQRVSSSFFPNSPTVLPYNSGPKMMPMQPMQMLPQPAYSPPRTSPMSPQPNLARMNSDDAVQLAMMLSEQEAQYGVNMYDSLKPMDESEIQNLIARGMTLEQAVYSVFERKFIRQGQGQAVAAPPPPPPPSMNGSQSSPSMNMSIGQQQQQQQQMQQQMGHQQGQQQQGPGQGMNMPGGQQRVLHAQQSFDSEMTDDVSIQNSYMDSNNLGMPSGYPSPYGQPRGYPGYGSSGYPPQQQQVYGAPPPGYGYPPQPQYGSPRGYGGYPMPRPPYAPYGMQQQPLMHPGMIPMPQGYGQYGLQQQPGYYAPMNIDPSTGAPPRGVFRVSSVARMPPSRGGGALNRIQTMYGVNGAAADSGSFYSDIPGIATAEPVTASPMRIPPSGDGSSRSNNSSSVGGGGVKGSSVSSGSAKPLDRPKVTKKSSIFGSLGFGGGSTAGKDSGGKSKLRYKEADVRAITDMGFTKDQAIWALVQNDNNVLHAINSLTR